MAKKVKLKQKDIQEIVLDLLKEHLNEMDQIESGNNEVYQLVQNPETGDYYFINLKNASDIVTLPKR